MKNKELIIISGVTGSMGQELLRKYLVRDDVLLYGISRKGVSLPRLEVLPDHHFIVSVDLNNPKAIQDFVSKIPTGVYKKITYFHLIGEFKTEINENLEVVVENDHDQDGIDDGVHTLVATAYKTMVTELITLSTQQNCELNIVSFGSLADSHNIECFNSFRKSREIVKNFSGEMIRKYQNSNFYLLSTSTILATDEMIERPYIFATDVNPHFWITPLELINRTLDIMTNEKGLVTADIYLSNPNFSSDYFCNEKTYKRRVKELFAKTV